MAARAIKKTLFLSLLALFTLVSVSFVNFSQVLGETIPPGILLLQYSYPDLTFTANYEKKMDDWKILIKTPDGKKHILYWSKGALLPEEELKNRSKYSPILYHYPREMPDPEKFSEEEKESIKQFGSNENRADGAGASMFFFDAIYGASSRKNLEKQLIHTTFLGHKTIIHKRIEDPLKRVEKRIYQAIEGDKELGDFIKGIKSTGAYNWRIIQGTKRKSFHSLGIAIDILPRKLGGKAIFWNWQKEKYPDTWMLTPLSQRWVPPKKLLDILENEGFIWGGKWVIFDNMHFEYRPELIYYNKIKEF